MGVLRVFGGAPASSEPSRCCADVMNQYFNPTEEPHKPGTKEKRKKAASFQTVSQLHKVRASRSSEAIGKHAQSVPVSSHSPAKTLGYLAPEGPPELLKEQKLLTPSCPCARGWCLAESQPCPLALGKDTGLQAERAMVPFGLCCFRPADACAAHSSFTFERAAVKTCSDV